MGDGSETRQFDLKLSEGQVVVPVSGDDCRVRITFPGVEDPTTWAGERPR